jgi:hypothetical protein
MFGLSRLGLCQLISSLATLQSTIQALFSVSAEHAHTISSTFLEALIIRLERYYQLYN